MFLTSRAACARFCSTTTSATASFSVDSNSWAALAGNGPRPRCCRLMKKSAIRWSLKHQILASHQSGAYAPVRATPGRTLPLFDTLILRIGYHEDVVHRELPALWMLRTCKIDGVKKQACLIYAALISRGKKRNDYAQSLLLSPNSGAETPGISLR